MINLFPKDKVFYNLFEKQAEKLTEAAQILDRVVKEPEQLEELAQTLEELEIEADSLGHDVVDHLRRSFITPLEGDDIDILRQKLDDIMDYIERAVNRMSIYKIAKPFPKEIGAYADILTQAVEKINKGMKEIQHLGKYQDDIHLLCQELNELENRGDVINRNALKHLMNTSEITPERNLERIKLKEIYETLEMAIDCCEDIGNTLESILIKNR